MAPAGDDPTARAFDGWRPTGRSCRCGPSCSPTSRPPSALFAAVAGDGPGILLESVERSERWGRYSFVAGDPAAVVVVDAGGVRLQDVARRAPDRRARRAADAARGAPAAFAGARGAAHPRAARRSPAG